MKKEITLFAGLLAMLVAGALVVILWKAPRPGVGNTPVTNEPDTKYVTSYDDGNYGYECSKPLLARRQAIPGPLDGPQNQNYDYIPVNRDEARLFCHEVYAIEYKGKLTVLRRPEVLELISHYEYKDVSIKALEFEYIEDKEFVHRLLPDFKGQEIGCIIVLQTPNEKLIYLEDENLEAFEQLDEATFERYLSQVSEVDRKLFEDNLR